VRRAALRSVLAAALALGCVLLPGAVSATAASYGPYDAIHLQRGRYHVSVGNLGQSIVLTVETGTTVSLRHIAATSYVAHGTATESRLEASFGSLGELSMRFHPSANRSWVRPDRNCKGLGFFLLRRGTWQGTLRFRGEGGYLSLDLNRVKGTVETVSPQCRADGSAGSGRRPLVAPSQEAALGPEVPVLQARWRDGVRGAEFIAGSGREGSNFFAATQESRGDIAIFRAAHAAGRSGAVRADNALTAAKLTPPSPFHAEGRFRAAADGSKTWDGGLFVSFPGAPHYDLTGKPFVPSLELLPELLVALIGFSAEDHGLPARPPGQGRLAPPG
jgi:hypothetical protein